MEDFLLEGLSNGELMVVERLEKWRTSGRDNFTGVVSSPIVLVSENFPSQSGEISPSKDSMGTGRDVTG